MLGPWGRKMAIRMVAVGTRPAKSAYDRIYRLYSYRNQEFKIDTTKIKRSLLQGVRSASVFKRSYAFCTFS